MRSRFVKNTGVNPTLKDTTLLAVINVRNYHSSDETAVLALNQASEYLLSPLNAARLKLLHEMSALSLVAAIDQRVVGFLLGFLENTEYDSSYYAWFNSRFKHFLYIDRIVIKSEVRGLGLGRKLYSAAIEWATNKELVWLTADINSQPPNTRSLAFHQCLGFIELSRQYINQHKEVSLQALPLKQRA